jgi:ATP-dependent DNA helicase RecG
MRKKIFLEKESKCLEFKENVPVKFDALIKTCIAFSNAAGGRIIIGVNDASREVTGVSERDRTRLYDDFPNSLYDMTQPSLIAQIYEKNYGDDSVIIIEIPFSLRKPCFIKSKGISNGTYIRVGSSTRKATHEYIEDLEREAQRISFDEERVNISVNRLSNERLHAFFKARVTKKRLIVEKIIAAKIANPDQFCPTIAGMLMFSEAPHDYIPEALVRCTRLKGIEGRDIITTADITGPLEKQADDCIELIKTWVVSNYRLQGAKYKSELPVPELALREAINNALLHRKYNIPGAIKVAVYDNRIEIFNPGDFPGPVDINSLGDGTTYLRNPALVRLAYKLQLIETRGSGIRLIYDSCKKAGIKKPAYHDEGDFVKIIFYFEPDVNSAVSGEDWVVTHLSGSAYITAQEVSDYLSVSRNTAIRLLNKLINSNRIVKRGHGPKVRYMLS